LLICRDEGVYSRPTAAMSAPADRKRLVNGTVGPASAHDGKFCPCASVAERRHFTGMLWLCGVSFEQGPGRRCLGRPCPRMFIFVSMVVGVVLVVVVRVEVP
jgi:hypothetical protein